MSDSLQTHGLKHARLSCPSLSPRVGSNSCPLSQMPSNHRILCHPLLLLPFVFPRIRIFSNKSVLRIRWPSIVTSASASILLMNIRGWFPFRIDWFDLLAVQGTLKEQMKLKCAKQSHFQKKKNHISLIKISLSFHIHYMRHYDDLFNIWKNI